jgi:flagellar basal body-associated protein FliL
MFVYDQNGNKVPVAGAENYVPMRASADPDNKDKKKKSKTWLWILLAVLVVAVAGLAIWHSRKESSPASVESPPAPPAQMGYGRRERFGFRFY